MLVMLAQKTVPSLKRRLARRAAKHLYSRPVAMVNDQPIVSITFDDCPRSAVTVGAPILERYGAQGTFYITGGLAGRLWENGPQYVEADLGRLTAAGHEVGCHTFTHADCTALDGRHFASELDANKRFLRQYLPNHPVETFAYPYGSATVSAKRVAQDRFLACRGVEQGLNADYVDVALLKAVAIPHRGSDANWITPWLQQAIARRGWLVLFTHDVADNPTPFGCEPAMLDAILTAIRNAGVPIMTVAAAAKAIAGKNGDIERPG
jgi:peptidoglycan/xylan/chitin deacetylase (PgdA/CDA1 family)